MTSDMRWASAISEATRLEDAIDEATELVRSQLAGAAPDLAIAFVSAEHSDHYSRLAPALARALPGAQIVGCSAGGVIGAGQEVEFAPALSITAAVLPNVEVTPFYLGADDASGWERCIGMADDAAPQAIVILPDPFSVRAESLVRWLDATYPDSVKLGGLASGARGPGQSALFLGDEIYRSGTVGFALSGDVEVDTIVAQGCRPIGSPMFATRVEGHAIFQLDGRRALDVLETLYRSLPPPDQALLESSLFLGLVMDGGRHEYDRGDFVIRNLIGLDRDEGALLVGATVEPNMVVQFHVRDAATSSEDLEQLLGGHRDQPAGALLFSCLGRGSMLYGRPNHDSELFEARLGPVPLGGFFCNGEIGPVQGRTFLHGYTSSFGLFRKRS